MATVEDIVTEMQVNPKGVRFADLCRICDHYFGYPRQKGTSHRVYKTPWQGDPRVNIQDDRCVFRTNSATHSDSIRPPVPIQFGRAFR